MRGILAAIVAVAWVGAVLMGTVLVKPAAAGEPDRYFKDGYREAGNKNVARVTLDANEVPKSVDEWIKIATTGQAESTRDRAIMVLSKIGLKPRDDVSNDDAEKVLKTVSGAVAKSDETTRRWIAGCISALGPQAVKLPDATKAYVQLLSDKDNTVRGEALGGAGNVKCDPVVAALATIAKNRNAEFTTRRASLLEISKIGTPKAKNTLTELIKSLPPELVEIAKEGIDKIDGLK